MNDHYATINNRFDERAEVLRKAGYRYETLADMPVAVFKRNWCGKVQAVAAGTVLYADDTVWADQLRVLVG
jgi:hypothetical protein